MNKNTEAQFRAYGTLPRNQDIIRLNLRGVSMTVLASQYFSASGKPLTKQRISQICSNKNNFEDIILTITETHQEQRQGGLKHLLVSFIKKVIDAEYLK